MRAAAALLVCALAGCGSSTSPAQDAAAMDATVMDVPSGFDAYLVDLRFVYDAGTVQVTDAAADVSGVDAGAACGMEPTVAVPATAVSTGNTPGSAFAFDGQGNIAYVGAGRVVLATPDGGVTSLAAGLAGTVVAARYAPDSELVIALSGVPDGGAGGAGAIVAVDPSTMTVRTVVSGLAQPGGLAVDAYGYVWFSDTMRNAIYRQLITDPTTLPTAVLSDVPFPGLLAFDNGGSNLYTTRFLSTTAVSRIALTWGAGGRSVTAATAVPYRTDSPPIQGAPTGLAADACGNLYVADPGGNAIWRIPPPGEAFAQIVTGVTGPGGLAFGQGAGFGDTSLYTLDAMGALRAANVGVPGVPLPLPSP